ncbi:LysR family transcriptional regulator [Fructobacillus ficulneus]|uniref:HTH lysR-type domain-containing protein n=1 Tax=Fructobacillus ficulneus TaxID=157463 RepID=A0A0K8MIJ5_9LACO|nr:LysR family transcriptional regulator [Fructobacillus ficulneus]GAP00381.1 hypothetical protein FFIC_283980 [Fructobacillus ficulneus]
MNKFLALKVVLEQQNISRAAEILGYTQPAVTQMLKSLEKDCGFPLLIKNRHEIQLTANGQKIFPIINQLINDYQALEEQKAEINNEKAVIKLATIPSISQQWLPKLISHFQEVYPNSEFSILQGDYTSIPSWVENGDADIGFVNLNGDDKAGIDHFVIQNQHLRAVLPQELAQGLPDEPLVLATLADKPYLLLEEGLFSESLAAFKAIGLEPKVTMRLHDSLSTILMVEQKIGYSIMPMDAETEKLYQIQSFEIDPVISRPISLLHRPQGLLTSTAKHFIAFAQENVGGL